MAQMTTDVCLQSMFFLVPIHELKMVENIYCQRRKIYSFCDKAKAHFLSIVNSFIHSFLLESSQPCSSPIHFHLSLASFALYLNKKKQRERKGNKSPQLDKGLDEGERELFSLF